MNLWTVVCSLIAPLRVACNRERNFLWLQSALAGICARPDLLGVSSIVRALGLAACCYDRLLDFFHSPGIDLDRLTREWTRIAIERFCPYRLGERLVMRVMLADGSLYGILGAWLGTMSVTSRTHPALMRWGNGWG